METFGQIEFYTNAHHLAVEPSTKAPVKNVSIDMDDLLLGTNGLNTNASGISWSDGSNATSSADTTPKPQGTLPLPQGIVVQQQQHQPQYASGVPMPSFMAARGNSNGDLVTMMPPPHASAVPASQQTPTQKYCRDACAGTCQRANCRFIHAPPCYYPIPDEVCKDYAAGRCARKYCRHFHGSVPELQQLKTSGKELYYLPPSGQPTINPNVYPPQSQQQPPQQPQPQRSAPPTYQSVVPPPPPPPPHHGAPPPSYGGPVIMGQHHHHLPQFVQAQQPPPPAHGQRIYQAIPHTPQQQQQPQPQQNQNNNTPVYIILTGASLQGLNLQGISAKPIATA